MNLLKKTKGRKIADKIGNKIRRSKLKVKQVTRIVEQMNWFGHINRMNENRLTRRIYEDQ